MIAARFSSDNGSGDYAGPERTFSDTLAAYAHLAHVLGLPGGTRVCGANVGYMEVTSKILNCVDTFTFQGTRDEMVPLFEIAHLLSGVRQSYSDRLKTLKTAVMHKYGLDDPEDIKAGLAAKLDDVIAAAQLWNEELCSFQEALALA